MNYCHITVTIQNKTKSFFFSVPVFAWANTRNDPVPIRCLDTRGPGPGQIPVPPLLPMYACSSYYYQCMHAHYITTNVCMFIILLPMCACSSYYYQCMHAHHITTNVCMFIILLPMCACSLYFFCSRYTYEVKILVFD